jgi:hypothetical protein
LNARIDPSLDIVRQPADSPRGQWVRFWKFSDLDFLVDRRSAKADLVLNIMKAKKSPGLLRHVPEPPRTWPPDPLRPCLRN